MLPWLMMASLASEPRVLDTDGSWCWFQDERCIVAEGMLHVGTVSSGVTDAERRGDVNLLLHDLASGETQVIELDDQLQVDDHNAPALVACEDGTLALWTTHGCDWDIRRRTTAADGSVGPIKTFNASADDGHGATYSNLYRLGDRLVNAYRGAGWDPNLMLSDDDGSSWRRGGRLLSGPGRPYVRYATDGRGNLHFVCTEQHPRDADNSLWHGYFDGNSVRNSSGELAGRPGETPPAPHSLTQVFEGDASNVAWCSNMQIDRKGRPVIVYSVQKDGEGLPVGKGGVDHRYRYARWNGTAWKNHEVAFAGTRLYAREDDYTGLICLDPRDTSTVYFSTNADPRTGTPLVSDADGERHWEIFRGRTNDGGSTWAITAITRNSTLDNLRPMMPEGCDVPVLLWLRGTYRTYTDFAQEVVCLVGDEISGGGGE